MKKTRLKSTKEKDISNSVADSVQKRSITR